MNGTTYHVIRMDTMPVQARDVEHRIKMPTKAEEAQGVREQCGRDGLSQPRGKLASAKN